MPEAEAAGDLYARYSGQIFAHCVRRLGNRDEAEDAMQSTFLNAFRGLRRGITPEFELAWLYKIADNVCLTRRRSFARRRRVETPGDLDAMQDTVAAREPDADELLGLPTALEGMPEQQRRALLLREWQGLSYKEIGQTLELSQGAVETLLFRARRSLARGLTEARPARARAAVKRLRTSGDVGSLVAVVKALLFGGGAKVAATVATVAATSVVAASPPVGQEIASFISDADRSTASASAAPTPPPPRPAPRPAAPSASRTAPVPVVFHPARAAAAPARRAPSRVAHLRHEAHASNPPHKKHAKRAVPSAAHHLQQHAKWASASAAHHQQHAKRAFAAAAHPQQHVKHERHPGGNQKAHGHHGHGKRSH